MNKITSKHLTIIVIGLFAMAFIAYLVIPPYLDKQRKQDPEYLEAQKRCASEAKKIPSGDYDVKFYLKYCAEDDIKANSKSVEDSN